jgi:phosphodiesterase/alkaline phosphatase D-like protein/glycerophosphoryl diester phosphodiesterase
MKRNQFKLGLFLPLTLVILFGSQSTTKVQEGLTGSMSPNHELNPNQLSTRPVVIGHGGASGFRPEHTLAAYELAIAMGADYIETDLVITSDGILVARHKNEISGTTDVAEHPEFADRQTTKTIDGTTITGWFTEDFTLAELKTLRVKERLPDVRPANTAFDSMFEIPTLQEVIDLAKEHGVGIYLETKHPSYFDSIGLSLEEPLVFTLEDNRFTRASDPVFIQSFEVGNLMELSEVTDLRLVQLLDDSGAPWDFMESGITYGDLVTPEGLAEIATYAHGVGVNKNLIIPRDENNNLLEPTSLIDDAHDQGLIIHAWTFRDENTFLPNDFRVGDPSNPEFSTSPGDAVEEQVLFLKQGLDGLFTDQPHTGVEALSALGFDSAATFATHGVASGDVTSSSAVVWTRTNQASQVNVEFSTDPNLTTDALAGSANATAANDFTTQVKLDGLNPSTRYYYRVSFSKGTMSQTGTFITAPDSSTAQPVSLIWAGDLGGHSYCRQMGRGYDIYSAMLELSPDFFIANGDMIYADGACPAEGPDGPGGWENIPGSFSSIADSSVDWMHTDLVNVIYRDHWRYNRNDPHVQEFHKNIPMYVQWDDHDVIDDFGAEWGFWNLDNQGHPGFPNIVEAGRNALFDYNPIDKNQDDPNQIFRSFNWGQYLDLFILDARSYRSQNHLEDTPENDKTMLGTEQLEWLKQSLTESGALWKVVSADVPVSIPGGGEQAAVFGRDGWANGTAQDFSERTGFEREFTDLLSFLDDMDVQNLVFVTTDAHWATNISYETDANSDDDTLVFHEFVSGPLSAAPGMPSDLDPTFNPTTLYAEGGIFNFGYLRVEEQNGSVNLLLDIRDETGEVRPGSEVVLTPES